MRHIFFDRSGTWWPVVVLATTCLAMPGRAAQQTTAPQTPAPAAQFRATVDLVQVDVVVIGTDGKPVTGLKQSDFTVADRGKVQPIVAFEEVSHAYSTEAVQPTIDVRHDVSDNRTAQSQRLVVVVVDDLHIFRGRTDRAKDLTKQVINTLGTDASMALLFTSGAHGVEVTENRSLLLASADTLKGRQAIRRPHEANDKQSVHGLDPEMSNDQIRAAIGAVGSSQDFFENMAQFKTLEDAARMIGGSDLRRKAFVLITEGMNKDLTGVFTGTATPCEMQPPQQGTAPASAATGTTRSGRGAAASQAPAVASGPTPCYHEDALRRTAEALRRSNVTMYALDPRGHVSDQDLAIEGFGSPKGLLTSPGGTSADEDSPFRITNPIRLAQDGLGKMSEATGGFAVTDSDDFSQGIGDILDDLDHYYLIGFLPDDPAGKGYRPLKVKVPGHPEWFLRFRAGYTPGGAPGLPDNADPLLSGALPKTDVPLRLFAEAFPAPPQAPPTVAGFAPAPKVVASTATARIAVTLEVTLPTASLLEADGKLHDDVTYRVVAVNADGKVAGRVSRAAALVMKPIANVAGAPPPPVVSYQVESSIDVPPGSYQLRASLASGRGGAGGSVYLPMDVPDFGRSALTLSGIAIGYAGGERVAVAPAASDATALPPSPVPFAPTLDRLFKTSDELRVYCQVRRALPADAVHVVVELLDAAGKATRSLTQDLAGAPAGTPDAGPGVVDQRMPLAGIAAGTYRLRVTAAHGSASSHEELGLIVR